MRSASWSFSWAKAVVEVAPNSTTKAPKVRLLPKFLNISLDEAKSAYSLFEEHLAGLNIGDTIDDESVIQSLEKAGINIDEYFEKNLNGTYVLTKKAEELA